MYNTDTEAIIPKYALEPDPVTGNKMFRMNRVGCGVSTMRSDFLAPHRKDYYFLVLVRQGSSRHWIDMTPLYPEAGYVLFYRAAPGCI